MDRCLEIHFALSAVGTVGTTSSGAVDRLDEIADVGAYADDVIKPP